MPKTKRTGRVFEPLRLQCSSKRYCFACRATAQHSAVNKGQVTVYTFTPNAPPALMQPPPTEKRPGGWEADAVRRLLPPPEIAEQYNEMCRLFVGFNKNAVSISNLHSRICRPKVPVRKQQSGIAGVWSLLLVLNVPQSYLALFVKTILYVNSRLFSTRAEPPG